MEGLEGRDRREMERLEREGLAKTKQKLKILLKSLVPNAPLGVIYNDFQKNTNKKCQ
jgi:hypothetical protein